MIRSQLSLLLCCLCSSLALAQHTNINTYKFDSNQQVLLVNRYENIDGSPYFLEKWAKGSLQSPRGSTVEHEMVNLNGHTGRFEVIESETTVELSAALFNRVELSHNNARYVFVNRLPESDLTYYRLIHEGKNYLFLEKFQVTLQVNGANYGVSTAPQKFLNHTDSFIWKDGQLHDINRTNKKILDFFNTPALNDLVRSKKLNLKEEADLLAALRYYDEQMSEK